MSSSIREVPVTDTNSPIADLAMDSRGTQTRQFSRATRISPLRSVKIVIRE
jgi:hypothetical protein